MACPGFAALFSRTDKEVFEDNLGIIIIISPIKHTLWLFIRIASAGPF